MPASVIAWLRRSHRIMMIHLSNDLARYIHAKVESGQFADEDAAVAETVRRFRQWDEAGWHGHVPVAMRRSPRPLPHGHGDVTMPPAILRPRTR
jgi:hypothetical protein